METIKSFISKRFSHDKRVYTLLREVLRKSIHICSSISVLFYHFYPVATILLLCCGVLFYFVCEKIRLSGGHIPIISKITHYASRKADDGKFVLGPLTLGIGIILSFLLFSKTASTLAIFSLSFGDGFASLIGRAYGIYHFTRVKKKTLAGSLACFVAVFVSSFFVVKLI